MNVTLMGDEGGADLFPLKIYQEKHDTLVNITPAHLPEKATTSWRLSGLWTAVSPESHPSSTPDQGVACNA